MTIRKKAPLSPPTANAGLTKASSDSHAKGGASARYLLLENLNDGCQVVGFDWQYLYLNNASTVHNRRPSAEFLGRTMTGIWPGIEITEVFSMFRRSMEERIALRMETEFTFPDGHKGWFDVRVQPAPEGILILSTDITERKRAEDVVREAARKATGRQKNRIIKDLLAIFGLAMVFVFILYTTDVFQGLFDQIVFQYKERLDELFGTLAIMLLGFFVFSYRRWKDVKIQVDQQAQVGAALRTSHGELEKRVQERTLELSRANEVLRAEMIERKQAQQAFDAERNLLRTVIDLLPDYIYVKDPQGRFLASNQACARLMGVDSPGQLIGKMDADFYPSARVSEFHDDELAVLGGVPLINKEEPFVHRDGTREFILTTKLPLKDHSGKITGLVGYGHNVTASRHAEEALRESEEKFRQLAEHITKVFWITDLPKQKMVYVSPAYEKIWGRTCESLYQSPASWAEAIHPDDRAHVQAAALAQAEREYDQTYRILRPDNSMRWIRDRAFPVRDAAGKVYRVVGTAEDVTDRLKLEEQFLQSQKMEAVGLLSSGVAHDFNNVLAVIQMQADMLKATCKLSSEQTEFADEISAATQRAAVLTRQLLMFSRKQAMSVRDLDLNASINNTTKMLRRTLGEDIQMHFKFTMQDLLVRADAGMIDQVLMNLAVNARDAMPEGGKLIIETSAVEFDETTPSLSPQMRTGSFVCLGVSDTGCGIPQKNLQKIFEPFFTTKEVGKGTGLGLATVFGIVQQHHGWINVYSETGKGTTFRIYLPRATATSVQKPTIATPKDLPGGDETILVVEDDTFLRASVRKTLTQLGYRVIEAINGVEAVDVWKQHGDEVDLLLTDMVMPGGMTGKGLGERLSKENPGLRVIYVSGYSAEVAGRDFPLEEGVNFLTKPYQVAQLAQTVRNKLDSGKKG